MSKLGKVVKTLFAGYLVFKLGSCYGAYKTAKEYKMREQRNIIGYNLIEDNKYLAENKLETKLADYEILNKI
ncbi:MAG: hypothetical protein PHT54_03085 [Candidatus Nanoarchaeia archaeon]|nr:hypothetical protein [Candidatus Nanoarchaeia archaeon]